MNALLRKPIKPHTQLIRLVFTVLYTSIVYGQNQCDITISSSATSGGSFSGTTFVPSASSVNINTTTLANLLIAGNATINTTFSGGNGSGNVTLSDALTAPKNVTSATTFTIVAGGTITLNATMNLQPADASALNNGRNAAAINFTATSNIIINSPVSTIGGKGGTTVLLTGGNGGTISLTSTGGSISVNGSMNASGGDAGSIGLVVGNGANITINAADGITLTQNLTSDYGGNGLLGSSLKGDIFFTNGATTVTTGGTNDGQTSGSVISGASLTKSGTGTLTLAGSNTFTEALTISSGILSTNHVANAGNSSPLGNGNTTPTITIAAGAILQYTGSGHSTNRAITLSGTNAVIDASGSGALTLTGNISGPTFGLILTGTGSGIISSVIGTTSGAATKTGSGTWTLSGTNTFTGGSSLVAGTLILNNTRALGTSAGTFTISGGVLDASSSITTVSYPLAINGDFTFVGTNSLNLGTGAITMNGNRIITVTTNTLTLGGALSDITRSLTKAGAGILHLGATAKSINSLTISAGTLISTSNTLTLAGNFTNSGTFTHNSGTVTYSAAAGGQIIGAAAYSNLIVSNTSSTNSLGGSISIETTLSFPGSGNGTLSIGSNTLTLSGAITNGTSARCFVSNGASNLVINGSGALGTNLFLDQTIPGTTNRLNNFIYNRASQTITLGDTLEITGILTPTAGTLATSDRLKLISTNLGTARVGAGSGSYISGTVTVERFIPAIARRWRFFSSPVSGTTLADLKNEMFVTGTGGAANGFDATATNQASVYSYNETLITGDLNTGFVAATNITNFITVGKGYRIFIRGDRSDPGRLTGTTTDQNAVTLNLIGPLNTGNITMPVSFTSSGNVVNDGWNFVGNPYASAYDWNAFWDAQNNSANCTNIDPTIYIFDASSNGYKSYNASSNAGTLTDGIIPASAGFWVKATATTPALILTETYKTASAPINLFKTNEGEGFKIRLEADSISYDELVVKYMAGASVNRDSLDIFKLASTLVNICAYGPDTQYLSASVRPLTNTTDTIRLGVYASVAGNYTLRFYNSAQIALLENVLLYDTYTSTITDLLSTASYPFAVTTGITASQGDNRFYIVVTNNTGLPVNLLSFTAQKQNNQTVKLNWAAIQELNNAFFEIERSTDGKLFDKIGNVQGDEITRKLIRYSFTDDNPLTENYYRLKQVDQNGSFNYSSIVYVRLEDTKPQLALFPVPAMDELSVQQSQTMKTIRIFDPSGILKLSKSIGNNTTTLNIQMLAPGLYMIETEGTNGSMSRATFIKE